MKFVTCAAAMLLSCSAAFAMQQNNLSIGQIMNRLMSIADAMSEASLEAATKETEKYDPKSEDEEAIKAVCCAADTALIAFMEPFKEACAMLGESGNAFLVARLNKIEKGYNEPQKVGDVITAIQTVRASNKEIYLSFRNQFGI